VKQATPDPPASAATSVCRYTVPFFDTDAMGIVHHANYVQYLELARIQFLAEHDEPYERYVAMDRHFAVTRCELHYLKSARFADTIDVTCWVARSGGASLEIHYRLECGGELLVTAATEHAMVDGEGHPRRIPRERRENFRKLLGESP
jgi:acyl-CoA thioester hydrolase